MLFSEPLAQFFILMACAITLSFGIVVFWYHRRTRSIAHQVAVEAVCIFRNGALLEANPEGLRLLSRATNSETNWSTLRSILKDRFPDFPEHQGTGDCEEVIFLKASDSRDKAFATIDQTHDTARVTISTPHKDKADKLPFDQSILKRAPYPIWMCDGNGKPIWRNDAYAAVAAQLGYPKTEQITELFDIRTPLEPNETQRLGIPQPERKLTHWFDVTAMPLETGRAYFAIDANTVVNAETAQRGVVQTVSRTFAQLPTGIAVFDRKHRLIVFNPALSTLTALTGSFLSSQPSLLSFFDGLREARVAPEPNGSRGWYDYVSDLIKSIEQGRFQETWELPTRKSLKVTGIPQRSGALALLFDDVTAELALTRRFRSDLDVAHGALDALEDPIALFAHNGTHLLCNHAYRKFWKCDPDTSFADYSMQDATALWEAYVSHTPTWIDLKNAAISDTRRESWSGEIIHRKHGSCRVTLTPIHGGTLMVKFRRLSQSATHQHA